MVTVFLILVATVWLVGGLDTPTVVEPGYVFSTFEKQDHIYVFVLFINCFWFLGREKGLFLVFGFVILGFWGSHIDGFSHQEVVALKRAFPKRRNATARAWN